MTLALKAGHGAARRSSIEGDRPENISRLQIAKAFFVTIVHDLARSGRMIEPNGVSDLVRQGVTQIVGFEIPIKPDLPAAQRIEAN